MDFGNLKNFGAFSFNKPGTAGIIIVSDGIHTKDVLVISALYYFERSHENPNCFFAIMYGFFVVLGGVGNYIMNIDPAVKLKFKKKWFPLNFISLL